MVHRMKAAVATGAPIRAVADVLKISERTFYNWLDRGTKQPRGLCRDFLDAFLEARGLSVLVPASTVYQAVQQGDGRLALQLLRGLAPETYARDSAAQAQVNVQTNVHVNRVEVDIATMSRVEKQALRDHLEAVRSLRSREVTP